MSFKVSLLDLGNLTDLDAHKRKRKRPPDEVFVSVDTDGAVRFEGTEKKPAEDPEKPTRSAASPDRP